MYPRLKFTTFFISLPSYSSFWYVPLHHHFPSEGIILEDFIEDFNIPPDESFGNFPLKKLLLRQKKYFCSHIS